MQTFGRWLRLFIFCGLGIYFLVSCSKDEEQGFLLLDPLREEKLQNTDEWKTFNESWTKYQEFLRIHNGDHLKSLYDQDVNLLTECLNKIEGFRKYKILVTDAEIEAMTNYFSWYLKHLSDPQVATRGDTDAERAESFKRIGARYKEIIYYFLKENQSLLNNLSRQSNWISWVKKYYIIEFIEPDFKTMQTITPDTLKYWRKPVSMNKISTLKKDISKTIEVIVPKKNN